MTSGDESLTDELGDWLRREPGLPGRVRQEQSPTTGTLGTLPELVIESYVSGAAGALATVPRSCRLQLSSGLINSWPALGLCVVIRGLRSRLRARPVVF